MFLSLNGLYFSTDGLTSAIFRTNIIVNLLPEWHRFNISFQSDELKTNKCSHGVIAVQSICHLVIIVIKHPSILKLFKYSIPVVDTVRTMKKGINLNGHSCYIMACSANFNKSYIAARETLTLFMLSADLYWQYSIVLNSQPCTLV